MLPAFERQHKSSSSGRDAWNHQPSRLLLMMKDYLASVVLDVYSALFVNLFHIVCTHIITGTLNQKALIH
jgi:hypothetical protein